MISKFNKMCALFEFAESCLKLMERINIRSRNIAIPIVSPDKNKVIYFNNRISLSINVKASF